MKIKFTALPTFEGDIQVSFDGGRSFKNYNVMDIRGTKGKAQFIYFEK